MMSDKEIDVDLLLQCCKELQSDCIVMYEELKVLREHAKQRELSYIPQNIAQELIEMLKPLDVVGEPNTIWALTKKAMKTIEDLQKEINDAKQLLAEHSSSPIAKERTLNDALRNMLQAYISKRDNLDTLYKDYACPYCQRFRCECR